MAGTERLKVNLVQGENRVQTVVRGQIEVPEAKPDVEKILSKDAKARVRDVSIVPNKVVVDGTLSLQVTYVACKPDQSVHSMEGDVDFTTYADVTGAQPGMDHYVEFTVEDVSLTRSKTNPRKFDVAAVLSTFVKVTTVDELDVLTSVPAGNQALETQNITVEHMVGDKTTKQVVVADQFDVPEEKPEVEKVLDTKANAKITGKRVIAGKVIVDGEVRLRVMYVAGDPEQSVHELHHTITFSDFVEVPDAQPGMNVHVQAEVESASVHPNYRPGPPTTTVVSHEDGLYIEKVTVPTLTADAIVALTVYVTETRTLTNVPTKLQNEAGYTKQILKVDREIGSGSTQVVLREATVVPEEKPEIEKVLESRVERTVITEKTIVKDKVLVRGHVKVEVVYVSAMPSQAVHAMHQQLNFRTFVPVTGAQPEMKAHVTVESEFVSVDQKGADLHTEAVLKVNATVTEMSQPTVYVAAVAPTATPTPTPCPPTAYTVAAGDTLGNIAAAHGVTVAMILAINPQITNPDVISVGQVIQIPCPAKG